MGHLKLALAHIKLAATRQVKVLRKLVEEGRIEEAQRMAAELERAGVLKKSQLGTSLKALGAGREGVADLVVGAHDAPVGQAVSVRKAYDPAASMYHPALPDRKVQIGQELRNDANFAQMYTKDQAHRAGTVPYHFSEYVPGQRFKDAKLPHEQALQEMMEIEARGDAAASRALGQPAQMQDIIHRRSTPNSAGSEFDIHSDNTRITPGGKKKVIDYMPYTAEELRTSVPGATHYSAEDISRMHPNLPKNYKEIESSGRGKSLDASRQNINKELQQTFGGSRQEPKIRGVTTATPPAAAAAPAPVTPPAAPASTAPMSAPPAAAASAAHPPVPAATPHMPPPSLRPTVASSLADKFHALPTARKAGAVGGAALGAGLLGYGAYRLLRPSRKQPAVQQPVKGS